MGLLMLFGSVCADAIAPNLQARTGNPQTPQSEYTGPASTFTDMITILFPAPDLPSPPAALPRSFSTGATFTEAPPAKGFPHAAYELDQCGDDPLLHCAIGRGPCCSHVALDAVRARLELAWLCSCKRRALPLGSIWDMRNALKSDLMLPSLAQR